MSNDDIGYVDEPNDYTPRHLVRRSASMEEARVRFRARVAGGLPGLWDLRRSTANYEGRHRG